ncbi:MerR family transcriptional regulator [Cohaesibacter celericrescens]|uniref:HTH-type transcriptional regulator CueR n=1 Tax=Cohaesibacter celericrescens TaxID=2067669 RepID=A0A2N5XWI1_9HYPH|nr:MerR family transcriptional regulator [Cohaesibacter celericrescens]PLW78778.1 Cu(I)-responsive transcriptional regulator [Cohaesibacter celericrescens]
MKISEAAKQIDLPVKTLRYYEEIGLVVPARGSNGYRIYRDGDLIRLRLVGRARQLGFAIDDCRSLLALQADDMRASADVKRIATAHLAVVDEKISQLQVLRGSLAPLVDACRGDEEADCAILNDFAQPIS